MIGENKTFLGGEAYLKQRGIEVVNMENKECQDLMDLFIKEKPEIWYVERPWTREILMLRLGRNEDIGEEERVYSKESK